MLSVLLVFLVTMSGCGSNSRQTQADEPVNTDTKPAEAKPPDPILLFVGSASDNERGQVLDPSTGTEVQVFVGRTYNAASGRVCRRYRTVDRAGSFSDQSGIACQDHSGQWHKVRPLLNLDNTRILTSPE